MGLIRSTLSLAFLGLFLLVGLTVPIGQRTLFGHVANIWESNEAQELVDGVKDSSGPLVDRVKRGVEAGLADEVATEAAEPGAATDTSPSTTSVPASDQVGSDTAQPARNQVGADSALPASEGTSPVATTGMPTADRELTQ